MMTPRSLIALSFFLSILVLHFFQTCDARNCIPSACGVIRNISYPFRLKGDPKHCGHSDYELTCENDVTSLSLSKHKYYVKEINHLYLFIRLVDASLNNHTCSFPSNFAYASNFNPYHLYDYPNLPINLMSCTYPLKNSSLFTHNFTDCAHSKARYSYIKLGHIKASEVAEMCRIDVIVMASWEFKDLNNASLLEIHRSLLHGFVLAFEYRYKASAWERFASFFYWILPPLIVVVGVLFAGLCPLTIIGLSVASVLILLALNHLDYIKDIFYLMGYAFIMLRNNIPQLTIVSIILAPRFLIFPIALWFMIYKFRRRHLSMYNKIESFLQSDNNLAPIRYSYSDIKKMTRGFKNKLGEGGYGSVYKGKLRSGRDVAVKLLRKSGADDRDFINEISTIGRIHHVNVVTLVGYCAQGSNRALIFDFMPNGSLEKYLFNREKMNSLNLDTKFEIAVGVARGIEYLHRGCDVQILHFDIKPHNVLLDDKFIPKISDFGLAKFFSTNKNTVTMTAVRGTIGYVAPELINRSIGAVSYKADVYSFGMLLMEMVSLKKDLIGNNNDSNLYFPDWIYDYFNQGKDIEIEIDDNDVDDKTRRLVRKMTIVALWCIQMSPNDRPSMNKVLEMLEGDVQLLQIPNYSPHSIESLENVDQSLNSFSIDSDYVSLLSHDVSRYLEITVQE